jgi:NAD(P)-dependent dehydrogenase (short-subunit alcohol dehydrogenase family)
MSAPRPMALVTGAGRGIGRAAALALSEAGHDVALTARSENELEATAQAAAGRTLVRPGDITDPRFVDELFDGLEPGIDVLVANAGAGASAPLRHTTDELWQSQLELNLTAQFRCLRRAVPAMVERGSGRVVVIASVAGKVGARYVSAYTAAKHGVVGLVRAVAAEVAGTGVTVNAVCPGYVDTPMTDRSVETIADKTGMSPEQARERLAREQPIGRLIAPEEVAAAVLFLVAQPAINGQAINVDGGAVTS